MFLFNNFLNIRYENKAKPVIAIIGSVFSILSLLSRKNTASSLVYIFLGLASLSLCSSITQGYFLMTTILLNQQKSHGLVINKQHQKLAITLAMAITLSACGGTADKIIDNIDTNQSTNISYINGLDNNTSFYLKSTIYNAGVYESQFKTIELMSGEVSEVIPHDWIDGANESVFAIENSITNAARVSQDVDINEHADYWVVAWSQVDESKLAVFEKKASNTVDMYNVRLLTTSQMTVKQSFSNDTLAVTEPGVVTASFKVEGCLDLMVGGNEIDLCSMGTAGESYLAVVNIEGQIVVVQE